MLILALDTSTSSGSAALLENDKVIAEQSLDTKITHSERLISSIQAVFDTVRLKIADVDAYAISIGPGSFTGLRIGLGAIKGFAFVHPKPVVGVSSMKALAMNACSSSLPVAAIMDARRGEFYIGVYKFNGDKIETVLQDSAMKPAELKEYLSKLGKYTAVGDHEGVPPTLKNIRAGNVAHLAKLRLDAGDTDDIRTLVPNYIRKSDAELKSS